MKEGKPTVSDIKKLDEKCSTIYAPVFEKFEQDQKYYELQFKDKLEIPKEFASEGIVLPTARDMVDAFVDHIDISNARVFVNKKGTSNISFEDAEMMRKFYLGLIHRTNVESDISPWRVAAKHYALHGLAVFKTVWDADMWPDKPVRKEGEGDKAYASRIDNWRSETHESIPIVIQAINPRNILPDPSYGGRMFVIEKRKKIVLDVSKRWPHWKNPKGKKVNEEADLISYWDKDFRCILVDGEPILKVGGGVVPHKYGFIPYIFIDTGLGNLSYDAKPEMRYVGMLRYMLDLLIAESREFSISDIVLKKTAWPWGYLTGENAKQVTQLKQTFGTYEPLPDGVEIHEMVSKTPPEALNAHLYRTSDYIAAHAAPRSVRGLSESGVRSGADRRLIIAEASARYQYSKDAFRNGTAKVLTNCAKLLKNVIPGDVRVWARTPTDEFDAVIKKDKMKEPFTCYVEFAPISEEDEYRRHQDLINLKRDGIVTARWARSQMSNVDPIAMERDEERELLRMSPGVLQVIDQYVAGRLAAAISAKTGAENIAGGVAMPGAQSQMMGMTRQGAMSPGRGLIPPIPQRAQPGSTQDIQRQLGQIAPQQPRFPGQGRGGGGSV